MTYCIFLQVYVTDIDTSDQSGYERYVVEQTRLFDIQANSSTVLFVVLTVSLAIAYVFLQLALSM